MCSGRSEPFLLETYCPDKRAHGDQEQILANVRMWPRDVFTGLFRKKSTMNRRLENAHNG